MTQMRAGTARVGAMALAALMAGAPVLAADPAPDPAPANPAPASPAPARPAPPCPASPTPASPTPAPADSAPATPEAPGFADWRAGFLARAQEAGIPAEVLARAAPLLRHDPEIVRLDRNQGEFTRQIWDYLDSAVSDSRVEAGRAALARHRALLDAIAARYGVEAEVIAAIWGLETAYGTHRGSHPVLGALATLTFDGRRGAYFEAELLDALRIVAGGHARLDQFTGSWAGASGHTQFMPSSFWRRAVDWTGDGRRDLWGDDPADALASTAAYLAANGWQPGLPWGLEVALPDDFPWDQSGERIRHPLADWAALGVTAADGQPLDRALAGAGAVGADTPASVLAPAGHEGATFLIFANFAVIETYNPADAYVIAVGSLSDRLRGGAAIRHDWPRQDRALTFDEKKELQALLLARGHDPQGIDGIMGPNTIQAVRAYQAAAGLLPDGYASVRLIERLRREAAR